MKELLKAIQFATMAHAGQTRKYTDEPFIMHPLRVAEKVQPFAFSDDMVVAAVLHDTVEDTQVTIEEIHQEFGKIVGIIVGQLTNKSKLMKDKNRRERKIIDVAQAADMNVISQIIRLADMADNLPSILAHGRPDFADLYRAEKLQMMKALSDVSFHPLYKEVAEILDTPGWLLK